MEHAFAQRIVSAIEKEIDAQICVFFEKLSTCDDMPGEDRLRQFWSECQKSPRKKAVSTLEKLDPVSVGSMNVAMLRALLKQRKQKSTGKKAELIARLLSDNSQSKISIPAKQSVKKKTAEVKKVFERVIEAAITVKKNMNGDYMHGTTGMILDPATKEVVGVYVGEGKANRQLLDEDIEICKQYKLSYTVPENLNLASSVVLPDPDPTPVFADQPFDEEDEEGPPPKRLLRQKKLVKRKVKEDPSKRVKRKKKVKVKVKKAKITAEKAEDLEMKKMADLEKKKMADLEKKKMADLEKKKMADLEKKRLADLEKKMAEEKEKKRLADLEKKMAEEKEKQRLSDLAALIEDEDEEVEYVDEDEEEVEYVEEEEVEYVEEEEEEEDEEVEYVEEEEEEVEYVEEEEEEVEYVEEEAEEEEVEYVEEEAEEEEEEEEEEVEYVEEEEDEVEYVEEEVKYTDESGSD